MSVEQSIETALLGHVRDLDADGARIAWPNVPFTPLVDETYIRILHLRNANTRLFVKGSAAHLRQGILQLTVAGPLDGGADRITGSAAAIAAQFPADLPLFSGGVKVRVQAAPTVSSPEKVDASWNVRVDVPYEAFA